MNRQSALRNARATLRGIAILFAFAGATLIWSGYHGDGAIASWCAGLGLFAVGAGLWLRQRWARWMALGACFLAIAGACIVPVILLIAVPFEGEFDGSMRVNLMWSIAAFAFGTIGYKGLSYFRSEQGRLQFAGADAAAQNALLAETSSAVMNSAGLWLLLLLLAKAGGLGWPTWLFAHVRPAPSRVSAAPPRDAELYWIAVSRDPAKWAGNSPAAVKYRVLPDLMPLALCYRDVQTGRVIDMAYANVGAERGDRTFHYAARGSQAEAPRHYGMELRVPDPDSLLTARFSRDTPEFSGDQWVDLDADGEVVESDESNNSARLLISRTGDGTLVLPACDSLRLRFVTPPGFAATTVPALPDLVPLGLCARGSTLIGVQFTNRGAPAKGLFRISQGHDGGDLQLVDKTYLSVPRPYEAMGFNVGVIPLLVGKRGQSANIMVKLDQADVLLESNEMNNVASARVTRRDDGSVDLPECDELAAHAVDPDWVDRRALPQPEAVPPPVLAPRPDLVPLGGCFTRESGTRGFMVVFGNAGTVSNPSPFKLVAQMGGGSLEANMEAKAFSPGLLWRQYFNTDPQPGQTLVMKIDTQRQVAELDESNNSLSYEFRSLPDGSLDVPECPKSNARVADWMDKMRRRKGS